jgi:hypothetical protein
VKSLLIALALVTAAQAPAQERGAGSAMVEELVVNARTPGPAWWSVSKGDAKVWVLGLANGAFREEDRWDTKVFERRLGKGGRLIHADTSPVARLTTDEVTTSQRWVSRLKPDDLERFVRAMDVTHVDPALMLSLKPNTVGFEMAWAAFPPKLSPKLRLLMRAKVLDARLKPVGEDLAWPLRVSLRDAPIEDFTCLNSSTRLITQPEAARAYAEAWMRGDVRHLVLGKMAYDPCQSSLPKFNEAKLRQDDALAAAIAETLDAGQNAVALVDLVPLLRQQGVLDQLRSRGYVVRNPAQLDED